MMNQLKNSVFSKVLQVLLIGYFLISSLNLSNTITRVTTKNTDIHKKESAVWSLCKKFIKCNAGEEEIEDESAGCNNKIKLTIDYLVPVQAAIYHHVFATSVNKIYLTDCNLNGILYNKIYLPPPERIVL